MDILSDFLGNWRSAGFRRIFCAGQCVPNAAVLCVLQVRDTQYGAKETRKMVLRKFPRKSVVYVLIPLYSAVFPHDLLCELPCRPIQSNDIVKYMSAEALSCIRRTYYFGILFFSSAAQSSGVLLNSMLSRVSGCISASSEQCRHCRANILRLPPYMSSPASGWPIDAMCTLI